MGCGESSLRIDTTLDYPDLREISGDITQLERLRDRIVTSIKWCQNPENLMKTEEAMDILAVFRLIESRIISRIKLPREYLEQTLTEAWYFTPYDQVRDDCVDIDRRIMHLQSLIKQIDLLRGHLHQCDHDKSLPPSYSETT